MTSTAAHFRKAALQINNKQFFATYLSFPQKPQKNAQQTFDKNVYKPMIKFKLNNKIQQHIIYPNQQRIGRLFQHHQEDTCTNLTFQSNAKIFEDLKANPRTHIILGSNLLEDGSNIYGLKRLKASRDMMTARFIEPLNTTYKNTKTKFNNTRKIQIDELQWKQYKQQMWVHLQHRLAVLQQTEAIAGPRNIADVLPLSIGKMVVYSTGGIIYFIVNKMRATKSNTQQHDNCIDSTTSGVITSESTITVGNTTERNV